MGLASTPQKKISRRLLLRSSPQGNRRSCLNTNELYFLKNHDLVLSELSLTHPLVFLNPSFSECCQPKLKKKKHQLEQTIRVLNNRTRSHLRGLLQAILSVHLWADREHTLGICRTGDAKYDLRTRIHFLSPSLTWLVSACLLMVLWRDSSKAKWNMCSCWTQSFWECFQHSLARGHSSAAAQDQHMYFRKEKGSQLKLRSASFFFFAIWYVDRNPKLSGFV